MPASIRQYKAAAVQGEPGWFDLELSVQKTINWINEAGGKNCKLIAFPETWIPGYPYWQWHVNFQDSLPLLKKYRQNSLKSDSDEMRRIRSAARANKIYVSLGYSEMDGTSLYMAQVIINPDGDVINHRRKIKPTHVERLCFGEGTGDSLDSVVSTEIGNLGHLNCWENMNPFLKAHACALHEEIHVAAWPVYPPATTLKYPDPYTNIAETQSEVVSPAYAIETGTWVLAPFQICSTEGAKLNTPERLRDQVTEGVRIPPPIPRPCHNTNHLHQMHSGYTRVYRPDGSRAVPDPDRDTEGLVIADIDLDEIHLTKQLADFGGHYMRPDLIRLFVDKTPKTYIIDAANPDPRNFPSTLQRVGLDKPLPVEDGSTEKS
ncbi:nitrilase [Saccharata proteae CBS 121410]|uniref:Nitrilase n=1 Tax=Saccharata proteae CBS 121410 TaxID=1314787 RepID=A0A9P4HSV2_9PEZI|nr:nitrilase [Saccharata proteae CBS 121410]